MGILKAIDGYKSYILMAAGLLGALAGYLQGTFTPVEAVSAAWAALGLGAIKSAVAKT